MYHTPERSKKYVSIFMVTVREIGGERNAWRRKGKIDRDKCNK